MSTSTVPSRAGVPTTLRASSSYLRRIALCAVLTALNAMVVAEFAGVLYLTTLHHPLRQVGVTLLFAALLVSLARTWFIALTTR